MNWQTVATRLADIRHRWTGFRAQRPQENPDDFLLDISGVIHVGANLGQERQAYAERDLDVAWVEPIPDVFVQLEQNLCDYPRQHAYRHLVTDQDDQPRELHIANNDGASSSILDLNLHQLLWPEVNYQNSITLTSITLSTLIERYRIDMQRHNALVMDTQGSELLVLKGAVDLLPCFRYIKTEVADFESYSGCCTLAEMDRFLSRHGFRTHHRHSFATAAGVGSYYDVVYRRAA